MKGGIRPSDIYASFLRAGTWTEPRLPGAGVTTPDAAENFAFFSPDGCELHFTRGFFNHVSLAVALAALAAAARP